MSVHIERAIFPASTLLPLHDVVYTHNYGKIGDDYYCDTNSAIIVARDSSWKPVEGVELIAYHARDSFDVSIAEITMPHYNTEETTYPPSSDDPRYIRQINISAVDSGTTSGKSTAVVSLGTRRVIAVNELLCCSNFGKYKSLNRTTSATIPVEYTHENGCEYAPVAIYPYYLVRYTYERWYQDPDTREWFVEINSSEAEIQSSSTVLYQAVMVDKSKSIGNKSRDDITET